MKKVFTINEAQLKKETQCRNHYWVKLETGQAECRKCPTAIKYDTKRFKLVKGKLLPR